MPGKRIKMLWNGIQVKPWSWNNNLNFFRSDHLVYDVPLFQVASLTLVASHTLVCTFCEMLTWWPGQPFI